MRELARQPALPQSLITGKLNVTTQTIQTLEKAELIEVQTEDSDHRRSIIFPDPPRQSDRIAMGADAVPHYYQEIRGVKYPMDERVIIQEILEELDGVR